MRVPRLVPPWKPAGPKVFFPNLVFRFVRSPPGYAPNEAVFRVPPKVNKLDIKTYLERLYGISITSVRTANYAEKVKWRDIKRGAGKVFVRPELMGRGLRPLRVAAYKRAIVTMTENFAWPEPPDAEKAESITLDSDFKRQRDADEEAKRQKARDEWMGAQKRAAEEGKESTIASLLEKLELDAPPDRSVRGGRFMRSRQPVSRTPAPVESGAV